MILNNMIYHDGYSEESVFQKLILIVLIIPVFSALRLANFNIDKNQTSEFIGLPTPANALFIASFSAYLYSNQTFSDFIGPVGLIMLIVFFSVLLLLPVRFIALKFTGALSFRKNSF